MSEPSRIGELLEERGMTQAALAREVGISTQAIWKLANGHARSSAHLHKIARALGTSPEYLDGETDDPSPNKLPQRVEDQGLPVDHVEIDSIELSYGMGGSFLDSDAVEVEKKTFPLSWIREFTDSPPDFLTIARGIGDSMMPTIHDRDVVLIDRSQRNPNSALGDRIWAVSFGGIGMIKRLRPMPDGTVKLSSDNHLVRDELATDGDLHIIGRVVGKSSRL